MVWKTITEPRAVKLLLDAKRRHVLNTVMLEARSVKQIAEFLGRDLKYAHDQIRTLERLGLIRVTHSEARQGRPIKHYRAIANGFFVPFHAAPTATLEGFIEHTLQPQFEGFTALFAKAGITLIENPREAGFRLYAQNNDVISDLTPSAERFDAFRDLLGPNAPALMLSFVPLKLSREDAKQLQREMLELLVRYGDRIGPEDYVAQVGLAPGEWSGET